MKQNERQNNGTRESTKDHFLGVFLVAIAFGYIFNYFLESQLLEKILSVGIVVFIVLSLSALQGSLKIITYFLLLAAIVIFVGVRAPIGEWLDGVRVNLTLVSIFTLVPLLGIPVRLGGYLESLKQLFARVNPRSSLVFLVTQTLAHALGVVFNIGSISIVHYLSKAAPIQSTRLLVSAINRGFLSVIFWSPYFGAVAVVLSMLSTKWGTILPFSLGFVLVSFLVSFLVDWSLIQKADASFAMEMSATKEGDYAPHLNTRYVKKKVIELSLLLLVMMMIVLGVEFFSGLEVAVIICLVALLFPLLWSFFHRNQAIYFTELKGHVFETLPRMRKEVVLFLVSGFFSAAFMKTNMSSTLITLVTDLFGEFTIGIAYCIVLVIVISSVAGLHPIVPVTVFASSFDPNLLGFSPEYFSVLLLASWGVSSTISPATASSNLLANLWHIEVTKIAFHWNLKYGIIMAILLPIYLKVVEV
ncbi:MAG TPA: hypothetical protein GXX18_02295 [Bacillales bacterium]|nr:hypothetical protein [Bacillales bacterium]